MVEKITEVLYYQSEGQDNVESVPFEKAHPAKKKKYSDQAKAVMEAIDKLDLTLIAKGQAEGTKKEQQLRIVAIRKTLKQEISGVSFLKRDFPKVSPDFWTELAHKISRI